jgi:hypothetical protein
MKTSNKQTKITDLKELRGIITLDQVTEGEGIQGALIEEEILMSKKQLGISLTKEEFIQALTGDFKRKITT